jgi:hypothetical protein
MSDSDTNKNTLITYLKDVVLELDDDGQDYGNGQDDEMGFLNHFFSEEGPCPACQSGADVGHLNIGPYCGSPEQQAKWTKMARIWNGLRPETKRAMAETAVDAKADDAKGRGRRKVTTKKPRSTKRRSARRAKRRKTKRRKSKRRKRRKPKRRKTKRKH